MATDNDRYKAIIDSNEQLDKELTERLRLICVNADVDGLRALFARHQLVHLSCPFGICSGFEPLALQALISVENFTSEHLRLLHVLFSPIDKGGIGGRFYARHQLNMFCVLIDFEHSAYRFNKGIKFPPSLEAVVRGLLSFPLNFPAYMTRYPLRIYYAHDTGTLPELAIKYEAVGVFVALSSAAPDQEMLKENIVNFAFKFSETFSANTDPVDPLLKLWMQKLRQVCAYATPSMLGSLYKCVKSIVNCREDVIRTIFLERQKWRVIFFLDAKRKKIAVDLLTVDSQTRVFGMIQLLDHVLSFVF